MTRPLELTRAETAALMAAAAAVITYPDQAPGAEHQLSYLESAGAKVAAAIGRDWAAAKAVAAQSHANVRKG